MPHPKKGETKKEYIGRCAGNPEMNEKFPDSKQRVAVCYSYWNEHLKECKSLKDYLMLCG